MKWSADRVLAWILVNRPLRWEDWTEEMHRNVLRAQRVLTKGFLDQKVKTVWADRPEGVLEKIPEPDRLFYAPSKLDDLPRPPDFILIVDPAGYLTTIHSCLGYLRRLKEKNEDVRELGDIHFESDEIQQAFPNPLLISQLDEGEIALPPAPALNALVSEIPSPPAQGASEIQSETPPPPTQPNERTVAEPPPVAAADGEAASAPAPVVNAPASAESAESSAALPAKPEIIMKTGAPGAPTSMHLIEGELDRRIAALKPGEFLGRWLREVAEDLSRWLTTNHREAPRCTPKTIQNNKKLASKIRPHLSKQKSQN